MKYLHMFAHMAIVAGLINSHHAAFAESVEKGKFSFMENGCWQCHGFVGQGGTNGPKLAPDPKPYEFISVFVRHTNGPMPPYSEKILSNEDLTNIHAYLRSIPKSPDYKTIPLLN